MKRVAPVRAGGRCRGKRGAGRGESGDQPRAHAGGHGHAFRYPAYQAGDSRMRSSRSCRLATSCGSPAFRWVARWAPAGRCCRSFPGNLEPAPLPLSEQEIIALAESVSPAVRAAEAASSVAGSALGNARSSYLPSAVVVVRVHLGPTRIPPSTVATRVGVSASRAATSSSTAFSASRTSVRRPRAGGLRGCRRTTPRRGVRQSVDAALRTLETQTQAIAIAQDAVVVAEEDLRLIRARYGVQEAGILDVITSQGGIGSGRGEPGDRQV